jgi:nodulation protein E
MSRRVAITGIGVVCAAGTTRDAFWASLVAGRSAIRPLQAWPAGTFRFACGAEAVDYDPAAHFEAKEMQLLDRAAQFALVAAREAVADAGVEVGGSRAAVVTGCCVGGQNTSDDGFRDLYKHGVQRVNPLSIPRVMANAGASHISMEFGITGPSLTISTACSSSNHAIGQAFWMLRHGAADIALAGGSEAVFSLGFLKAWEAMRVVSPDTCRPFSRDRKGMILGEGGAMLVLELLDAALARGARVYAEVAGFGMSSDAHHITQPSSDGAAQAMTAALADADLAPERIGYINAHGTGTVANDSAEVRAIRQAVGTSVAISSTKSVHGHTLGAAGAIEAAATALALHRGMLPPTANLTELDPECEADIVTGEARQADIEAALSNSFAFGGMNAVLALRRPSESCT